MLELLERHEAGILLCVVVGSFCIIALAEQFFPRRKPNPNLGFRWLNNISLAIVTTFFTRAIYVVTGLTTTSWVYQQEFGLIPWLSAGWAISFAMLLLVLGFGDYITHRLMHTVPVLWRLHAVHHSDTDFDVTTTYRNHPFAALTLLVFRLPFIVLLGAPVSMLLVYEIVRVAQDLWSHSNTRLPPRLEKYFRWMIVTPDFHRIHHCSDRRYTDSNFSSTVPWYDYLFGSYRKRPIEDHSTMEIGIERFRDQKDSRLDGLLLIPFRRFS